MFSPILKIAVRANAVSTPVINQRGGCQPDAHHQEQDEDQRRKEVANVVQHPQVDGEIAQKLDGQRPCDDLGAGLGSFSGRGGRAAQIGDFAPKGNQVCQHQKPKRNARCQRGPRPPARGSRSPFGGITDRRQQPDRYHRKDDRKRRAFKAVGLWFRVVHCGPHDHVAEWKTARDGPAPFWRFTRSRQAFRARLSAHHSP